MNVNVNKHDIDWNAFCIAFILMVRTISSVAIVGFQSTALNNIILLFLFCGVGYCFLVNNRILKIPKYHFITLTIIFAAYIFYALVDEAMISFGELALYSLIPIMLSCVQFDAEKTIRYVLVMSLMSAPVLDKLLTYEFVSLQQIDMARAYALFVGVAASVIHFLFYKNKKSWWIYLSYLYNAYIAVKLILIGNRGIYVSFAVLVVLCQISYLNNSKKNSINRMKWFMILLIEVIVFTVFALFFDQIVLFLYDLLTQKAVIVPSFLIKMRRQIQAGDISNGRSEAYSELIQLFLSHPLGNGIEATNRLSNGKYAYPHNFLLQFWIEGGIVFGTLFNYIEIKPVIYYLRNFNKCQLIDGYFLLFLIVITVPKMLISGDIWMQPQFWLIFGYGLRLLRHKSKEKK